LVPFSALPQSGECAAHAVPLKKALKTNPNRTSFQLSRQIQDEISAEANSHHAAVVADAQKYGNEEQVRRMVDRMSRSPFNQSSAK